MVQLNFVGYNFKFKFCLQLFSSFFYFFNLFFLFLGISKLKYCKKKYPVVSLKILEHFEIHTDYLSTVGPYFFLILGLRIFFQNIKVGGGEKIKIKITKKIFFI